MPHEQPSAVEREQSPEMRPMFDFEQMETEQVFALIAALGMAYDKHQKAHGYPSDSPYASLMEQASQDLRQVARTSDRALDIYNTLASDQSADDHTISMAGDMAVDLLQRHLDEPRARQQILGPLVSAVHHEGAGGDVAWEVSRAVLSKLASAEWLDEPTKRYCYDQLPD